MDIVFLIGRVLFALIFLASALGHLTQTAAMTGYAQMRGLPAPKAGVILSGLAMLVGGVSVLLGYYGDLGSLILAVLMVVTAFAMHHFWSDPADMKQNEQTQFLKDIALAGGALGLMIAFQASSAFSVGGLFFQ